MNLLVDTHVLIWTLDGAADLSNSARDALEKEDNTLFVSVATVWEAEIKAALRKLPLPGRFMELTRALASGGLIAIDTDDAVTAARLPLHHGDPFDRMLIAHALRHELTIVTHDRVFGRYAVPVMWA
ncbi:MAG: type II toxin-antitoxin system VapC family toxin [Methylocystis sp.]|nr:type II toxin-antitoxin system VapC family toxin [Methylocystis sp.]